MRASQATAAQQALLVGLARTISDRLEAEFIDPGDVGGPNVGVCLRERGRTVAMEVPAALLEQADVDRGSREALRVRLKGRRDRMMFRPPPAPGPRNVVSSIDPAFRGNASYGFRGRR